jgi:hypothetical protein
MNKLKQFLSNYRNAILAWLIIVGLIILGFELSINKTIIGFVVVIVGLVGEAFAALGAWVTLVPIVGPLVVKVLALPFLWLLNGVGYVGSFVAIKKGYGKDVVSYRVLTITLLVGVTIGYILGKLI